MANTIITATGLTREALRILTNNLSFSKTIYQGYSAGNFGNADPKEGDTLNVRVPSKYKSVVGSALDIQPAVDNRVPITLTTQRHVDVSFSTKELTLDIDDFSRIYLEPAMAQLANDIDHDAMSMYQHVYNNVGTPGTTPATALVILKGGVQLDNNSTPMDDGRYATINPIAQAEIVNGLRGLFQDSSSISSQYIKGQMGRGLGFNFMMDQNVNLHTTGLWGGEVKLFEDVVQDHGSVKMYNFSGLTEDPYLNKGDVFTIQNVYGVNSNNKTPFTYLQSFTCISDTEYDSGTGVLKVSVSPKLSWEQNAWQNIDSQPKADASVYFNMDPQTRYPMNLLYHRDAFAMVMADLTVPNGTDMGYTATDPELGISIRMIRDYDINSDTFPCRLDVLYGFKTMRPETACRLIG